MQSLFVTDIYNVTFVILCVVSLQIAGWQFVLISFL